MTQRASLAATLALAAMVSPAHADCFSSKFSYETMDIETQTPVTEMTLRDTVVTSAQEEITCNPHSPTVQLSRGMANGKDTLFLNPLWTARENGSAIKKILARLFDEISAGRTGKGLYCVNNATYPVAEVAESMACIPPAPPPPAAQ